MIVTIIISVSVCIGAFWLHNKRWREINKDGREFAKEIQEREKVNPGGKEN